MFMVHAIAVVFKNKTWFPTYDRFVDVQFTGSHIWVICIICLLKKKKIFSRG